jgi:hypothetical protein
VVIPVIPVEREIPSPRVSAAGPGVSRGESLLFSTLFYSTLLYSTLCIFFRIN